MAADDVVIEGVELDDLVAVVDSASDNADRIELCGGVDVSDAARVIDIVAGRADVRVNRLRL